MHNTNVIDCDNSSNIRNCIITYEIPYVFNSFAAIHVNAGTWELTTEGKIELIRDLLHCDGKGFDVAVISER